MNDALYLAWRSLAHRRLRSLILLTALTVLLAVPAVLRVLVSEGETRLVERARSTPLLVGAPGSSLDLVLRTLYFAGEIPPALAHAEVRRVQDSGHATAIPLHTEFRAGDAPIVGTSLDYFDARGMRIAEGSQMMRLGDCVLGAEVAAQRGLGPDDEIVSSPEQVFALGGTYPLKMRVRGVLAPTESPDDEAVFVDVRTAWIIAGLAHGHDDLATPEAASQVLSRDGNTVRGNASIVEYAEVTPENEASFHFHGEGDTFPVTAVLAVPHDAKSSALLRGTYAGPEVALQAVVPDDVLADLLETVVTVESYVTAALGLVALAALLTVGLVFALSIRLRERELRTMALIGAARGRVGLSLALELAILCAGAALLAGAVAAAAGLAGDAAVRGLIG